MRTKATKLAMEEQTRDTQFWFIGQLAKDKKLQVPYPEGKSQPLKRAGYNLFILVSFVQSPFLIVVTLETVIFGVLILWRK